MRTEPPMSLPCAMAPMPVAVAAPAPPLEPPGVTRGIARIERAAVQRVVGEDAHREGGRIGAADDDRAGMLQVGDDRAVFLGDEVLERDDAVVGRQAGLVDVDLGGDRHAVQRRQGMAARAGGVGGLGLRRGPRSSSTRTTALIAGLTLCRRPRTESTASRAEACPVRISRARSVASYCQSSILPSLNASSISMPKKIMLPSISAMPKSRRP